MDEYPTNHWGWCVGCVLYRFLCGRCNNCAACCPTSMGACPGESVDDEIAKLDALSAEDVANG